MRGMLFIMMLCALTGGGIWSEEGNTQGNKDGNVITAASFFQSLSDRYAAMSDYEAAVNIVASGSSHDAALSCKGALLRLDFSKPKGQTIVFNGDALIVYLPEYSAVLQQVCDGNETSARLGLQLLSRYYFVQYATTPSTKDEGIVSLVAYPRGAAEAFRSITLDVDKDDMLIKHVKAVGRNALALELTFSHYAIGTGIPPERFMYDPPSSANYYNNFLMGSEEGGGGL